MKDTESFVTLLTGIDKMEERQLAVITGGTKGIGRALVEKFLLEGHDVITCARSTTDLEKLGNDFKDVPPHLYCRRADLSLRADLNEFVDFISSLNRPVSVLVNNTGIFVPGQVHNEQDGVLEKVMETNVYSAYHITRAILPAMMSRKKGHVFMMGSTASIIAYPNGGSYCISKFALYGMTKVLREEMKAYGVKVTAILPGATFTDSWKGTELPVERFMHVNDVAETIFSAYSLSPGAVVEEILIRPQLGDLA